MPAHSSPHRSRQAQSRPSILLFLTDQQRRDTVSAYGADTICRTPHIDALAARGVRFDQAFTPTAICSPARASLFTGVYPHKHGVTANGLCLNPDVPHLAQHLAKAGYRNGYAGKWHVDNSRGPSQYGFQGKDFLGYAFPGSGVLPGLRFGARPLGHNHYVDYLERRGFTPYPAVSRRFVGTHPGNQNQEMFALHEGPVESCVEYFVAEETMRVLDQVARDGAPFFVWANFWGPHTPCLVPEPYFSMYDPDSIPEHPSYCESFRNKPYRQQLIERFWGLGDFGWAGFQQIGARYFGHCTLIDDMIGRVLSHLQHLGRAQDTVVIFAADHGDAMGAHRLIEKGEFMYDETYRIPLIVAHPDCAAPGSVCDEFVYLHDLMPSCLELAGMTPPPGLDAMSLVPAMLGDVDFRTGRDDVYAVFDRHFTVVEQRMVRTRTHQFTFNPADQGELYDLVKDPYQLHNVFGMPEYTAVEHDLMDRMAHHMETLGDPVGSWFRRIRAVY